MRSVARKQGEQQAVRGRIGEHDAVGCIAVLANEIEERGEISRKQQWAPGSVLNERVSISAQCPLLGAKRTSRGFVAMSAFDPRRTSLLIPQAACNGAAGPPSDDRSL